MKVSFPFRRACAVMLVSAIAVSHAQVAQAQANGTLVIGHEANPDDVQDFNYTVDGATPGGATLDDDATATGGDNTLGKMKTFSVVPGDYQIIQANPGPGWVLTGIQCGGTSSQLVDLPNRKVTLNIASGAQATCKFLNQRPSTSGTAKIVIRNQTSPDHVQDFKFSGTGPNGFSQAFLLDDDLAAVGGDTSVPRERFFANLPAGTYNFKEDTPFPAGWVLTGINCPGSGPPNPAANPNLNNRSVEITLAAGQEVQCDFIHQQANAEIRIIKDAMPNSLQDFEFKGSGPNLAEGFYLDDDATVPGADNQRQHSKAFIVPAGQYVFTEMTTQGWALTGLTCNPAASAVVDQPGRKATITIGGGQTVTCTYRNKPVPPSPCTGHPFNVTVNFVATPPSWGPQTVNICRGGTVTFKNMGINNNFSVAPSTPPASFAPIPLTAGTSQGTTTPFQTPGTYKYFWSPGSTQGTIIVHP